MSEDEKYYVKFSPNVWADENWLRKKLERLKIESQEDEYKKTAEKVKQRDEIVKE